MPAMLSYFIHKPLKFFDNSPPPQQTDCLFSGLINSFISLENRIKCASDARYFNFFKDAERARNIFHLTALFGCYEVFIFKSLRLGKKFGF